MHQFNDFLTQGHVKGYESNVDFLQLTILSGEWIASLPSGELTNYVLLQVVETMYFPVIGWLAESKKL